MLTIVSQMLIQLISSDFDWGKSRTHRVHVKVARKTGYGDYLSTEIYLYNWL